MGGGFGGEKFGEEEVVGGKVVGIEDGGEGVGIGDGDDGEVFVMVGVDEVEVGVVDGGGVGVVDEGDGFVGGELGGEVFGGFGFVVVVVGDEWFVEVEVCEE